SLAFISFSLHLFIFYLPYFFMNSHIFMCHSLFVLLMFFKTWEEALEYCRENHRDLASVASQTELTLMHKELGKSLVTEDVWIGLRFLDGNWLWVDSQPFEYEAWSQESEVDCPELGRCAALVGVGSSLTSGNTGLQAVWTSQKCDQKLYFLCY
uniref:C-type lectin domain-containing protein n=1 Tax=Periophthalmus magnuspinnatus TaxID=409849 RepID=A0A3B3ZEN5_9GOBI